MTLTQIRYFFEACKWESISRAAAELSVSQPTVSVAIRELERETGLNLFRREGKKLSLTEEGQTVWEKITPILSDLEQLQREIKDLAQNKNHIRLAVPLQIGVTLLPALFTEFKAQNPDISLEVVESGGIDALKMVENEELDLAVTNYDDRFSDNLVYHKLGESEICFCTYKDHPLAARTHVTIQDVSLAPLALLNCGFFINRIVTQAFQEQGLCPNVLLYSSQLHTVKNLVKGRLASTFMMRQAITADDGLAAISLQPQTFINSGIVVKKGRQTYGDENKLICFIRRKHASVHE